MTKSKETIDLLTAALKLALDDGDVFLAYLIGMAMEHAKGRVSQGCGTKEQAV